MRRYIASALITVTVKRVRKTLFSHMKNAVRFFGRAGGPAPSEG
jgi:hypothetical protein